MGRDYVDDHRFYLYRAGGGPEAVSYTHLDVYKRQAIECVDVGRIVFFPQQIHFDGHSVKP